MRWLKLKPQVAKWIRLTNFCYPLNIRLVQLRDKADMTSIEMQYDNFSESAITAFWSKVAELNMSPVDIELDTETATLTAKTHGKTFVDPSAVCVRLNAYEVMLLWDKLAESMASDEYYDATTTRESESILEKAKDLKPKTIEIVDLGYK